MKQRAVLKQFIKEGSKRFVGKASAWQAHLERACTVRCFYCKLGGRLRTVEPQILVPETNPVSGLVDAQGRPLEKA